MLLTVGLLLLLTPFHSLQTPISENRNTTGSDGTKPITVLTLSKPKTSAAQAKQTGRPTPKPNAVTPTVSPTAAPNQKPTAINPTTTSKSKPGSTVTHTTLSPPVKTTTAAGAVTKKDKHTVSVNQTVVAKTPAGEVKVKKHKSGHVQTASTKSATVSSAKTSKDKVQPGANQTLSVKPPSTSDAKTSKDKVQSSVNQTVSVKLPSTSEGKATKDKVQPSVNQTVSVKLPPTSEGKATKDKVQPSANQTVSVKSPSTIDAKTSKDKVQPSVNQTVSVKLPPTNEGKATKDKVQPSVNQTVSVKSPSTNDKTTKDKLAPNVQNAQSTSSKSSPAGGNKTRSKLIVKSPSTNDKAAPTVEQTVLPTSADIKQVPASADQAAVVKAPTSTKDKSAPAQPVKVVIMNNCESSPTKDQEMKLAPGAPLVMTHKISWLPGGCTGSCDTEMAALKVRVAQLEKEMSSLKDKCPCSANCPNDCSGNGECEKGKCVCQQGFQGPDCSKCAEGVECSKKVPKGKVKVLVETVALKLNKDNGAVKDDGQERTIKVDTTQSEKKEQKRKTEAKDTDTKSKGTTAAKAGLVKAQVKLDSSDKKITVKGSTKTSHPVISQVLSKHEGRKQAEARKGKTTILSSKKASETTNVKLIKEGIESKSPSKSDQLKDEPHSNVTHSDIKKHNGTAKTVTIQIKAMGTNKTRSAKDTMEQSTLADKNSTQSSGSKTKKVKVETVSFHAVDNRSVDAGRTVKGKVTQRSQYKVNATNAAAPEEGQGSPNRTSVHSTSTRRTGGSGLGSVKVVNVSSYSFTVTWSAPQGMFKNFTVIRREPRMEADEDDQDEFEDETLEVSTGRNTTEGQAHSESTNTTSKARSKAETKRISMMVPGNVRSVEFSNLRANTRYLLHIYGSTAERRSKIHRVAVTTGPEPATDLVFSNVTESSLGISWSKPKSDLTGFRVTYTHVVTAETRSVSLTSHQSHVVLTKLSAGSSYIISVTCTHGRAQSDALVSVITTVPAPPTQLQAVGVTDTKALLQWTPSLGKVDRFIISYESSKTPNVTVTVMLSGNSVEHQLRGLQRGTMYTVKVLSQKDSLQSSVVSTTFMTANVVKASEVGARSAVIVWRSTTVVYHSYRLIYQVAGEETRELILEPTLTEYKLTGLLPMSRYHVVVQGERDGHYTSLVTTEFITGKLRFPFPTECSQELLNGALQSGEVDIYPQGREGPAVRVFCDMETDGGGWTVFQRRMNGKTDFYRSWSEYRAGFGNLSEEFWLGNELLHNLTSIGPVSLRVDMRSGNESAYAHYANFSVDSEERHYTLTVSGYTGTAGDSMRYHNSRPFSSRDKDPDSLGIHCSRAYMGGWWYKNCYKTNLNGLYGINSNNQGVVWIDWKGKDASIPFVEMKFRPSRFSPATHG